MIENLQKFFPTKYNIYDHQKIVLQQIQQAINEGHKFIVIQSPTGTGKSMISATLSNLSRPPPQKIIEFVDDNQMFKKDSYGDYICNEKLKNEPSYGVFVLTITKMLQEQYNTLFDTVKILKGKNNYECSINDEFTVDFAPCILAHKLYKSCETNHQCDYLNKRDDLIKSKFGVLNYSLFLSMPEHIKKRQFLICDEASEIEDELVGHFSVTVDLNKLKMLHIKPKPLISDNRGTAFLWLTDLAVQIKKYIDNTKENLKGVFSLHPNEVFKLRHAINFQERLNNTLQNWNKAEYVIERKEHNITFVPLYVDGISQELFNFADVNILMSATIIDHKTFTKSLGIEKYKYIEIDSVFDSKKSPIYCPGKLSLSFKEIDKNLPKILEQAIEICNHYKDKKGIIHTHSFKITEGLQKKLNKNSRFLFREDKFTNEHIIQEHFLRNDSTVLVSPSLGYGVDLYGDFGKFQIIMKLPYLPLGSKRVSILFKRDKDWYLMKMLIALVQMCGRCTRSKTDEADTFILDGQTFEVLKRNWDKLPQWFKSRLI